MNKVLCFGELLLRLSPALGHVWIKHSTMPVYLGGAELNVATALAKWGLPVKYASALPGHHLAKEIVEVLDGKKIDTSAIQWLGQRIGTYYLPVGAELKSAGVIYDRAGSSFSELKPGMIDWDHALDGCNWFHFSAISPALNENVAAVCLEGLQAASAKKLRISVDLNYRAKLWQYGKLPADVMPALVEYCSAVMGNIWAAESLLGISAPVKNSEGCTKDQLVDAARKSMVQFYQRFPNTQCIAYTYRLPHEYWALLQHGDAMKVSKQFGIAEIKDRAGSGDCFMAGLIYGLYNKHADQQIVDFASAAAAGKLSEAGDATDQSVEMINAKLMKHD